MSEPTYIQTYTLRSNPGMIRDCWVETDEVNNQKIFCIRQTNYDSVGSVDKSKIIRLTMDEAQHMFVYWEKHK